MRKLLLAAVFAFAAHTANAGVQCMNDYVTSVVAHSNGEVYFTTANKCTTNWCVLQTSATTTTKQMVAQEITEAFKNNYKVNIYFNSESNCTTPASMLSPAQYLQILK